MGAVWAIAAKDLRLLVRDRMGVFWALGFPLIMALFFGVISGGGGRARLSVAVDDQAKNEASRALVAGLEASPALEVEAMAREAARDQVRRGRRAAVVVIPAGFGAGGAGAERVVEVGVDPARTAEAGLLRGVVQQEVYAAVARTSPEARAALVAWRPPEVRFEAVARDAARPATAFEVTFPSGILWGIIGCVATFAVAVVVEREKGTLARLRVAPIGDGHVLAGKALACFVACVAVVVVLVTVAHVVFGVRVARPELLALGAVCTAACFVGVMMLLSVVGRTERAVAGAAWGVMLPMSMLGGGMIPLIAMPAWMQVVSHASPVRWGIVALEGAIWRGYGTSDMIVPCAVLLLAGGVCFAVGAGVFARRA
jgi:ABC-2 type transport system permease protein